MTNTREEDEEDEVHGASSPAQLQENDEQQRRCPLLFASL